MEQKNLQNDLENIKKELNNAGAEYTIKNRDIYVTLKNGTTLASAYNKSKPSKGKMIDVLKTYYFQNGIKIIFPARWNYYISALCDNTAILSPIQQP